LIVQLTHTKAGMIERLSGASASIWRQRGYLARGGQMVDATIMPVPKQRNSREENEAVKVVLTRSFA
jgi:hypothetical protein